MSEVNLSTDETRVSYGIGRQLGDQPVSYTHLTLPTSDLV